MLHVDNGLLLIASSPITRHYAYAENPSAVSRQRLVPHRDVSGRKMCETTNGLLAELGFDMGAIDRLRYASVTYDQADGTSSGVYEIAPVSSQWSEYGLFCDGSLLRRSIYCGSNTSLGIGVPTVLYSNGEYTTRSGYLFFVVNYGTGEMGTYSIGGSAVKLKSFVESAPSDKHYTVTETVTRQ